MRRSFLHKNGYSSKQDITYPSGVGVKNYSSPALVCKYQLISTCEIHLIQPSQGAGEADLKIWLAVNINLFYFYLIWRYKCVIVNQLWLGDRKFFSQKISCTMGWERKGRESYQHYQYGKNCQRGLFHLKPKPDLFSSNHC